MKKLIALVLVLVLCLAAFSGCKDVYSDPSSGIKDISVEDALSEMNALLSNVKVSSKDAPIDISALEEVSEADALADISTFPIMVTGNGQIDIEIAAATEMSADSPCFPRLMTWCA